jgi:choline/ethanolamine kinase
VFPEGRLELFLEGRSLKTPEIFGEATSLAVARGLARLHGATLPLRKTRDWASRTMRQ